MGSFSNTSWALADVQGLAWRPDASQLVTCSIDGSIMVWSIPTGAVTTGETLIRRAQTTLKGHDGWVKAVAWDPIDTVTC